MVAVCLPLPLPLHMHDSIVSSEEYHYSVTSDCINFLLVFGITFLVGGKDGRMIPCPSAWARATWVISYVRSNSLSCRLNEVNVWCGGRAGQRYNLNLEV